MEKNGLILLVDSQTLTDKLHAHEVWLKHYSYSVFIFNHYKELLLQKRAANN
jgi:isopentenyldiphosphate isomerase